MGTIISEIDNCQLIREIKIDRPSTDKQFYSEIQSKFSLKKINQDKNGFQIYEQIQKSPAQASLTPVKLGNFSKDKKSCNTKPKKNPNNLSLYSNSRINFRVTTSDQIKDSGNRSIRQYILKTLNITSQNEVIDTINLYTKTGNKLRNTLALLKYVRLSEGTLCTSRYRVHALFEYEGDHSLSEEISIRSIEYGQQNESYFSVYEVMKFFKFMLGIIREFKEANLPAPIFSLSDIIISQRNQSLKYRNPIDSLYFCKSQINKSFYCPQNLGRGKMIMNDEKQSIFSFGMCMLAICLLSDMGDSYNFAYNSLCISILETRIQQLKARSPQNYWLLFCETVETMVNPNPYERPTLTQLVQMCNDFLAQMRIHDCDSTQMMLSQISTCYNKAQNEAVKIYRSIQDSENFLSGRSQQKQVENKNMRKKQSQFSGSKCLTARWNQSSQKKRESFDQRGRRKAQNSKQNYISEKENEKRNKYQIIDNKWKSQDELFRNMPCFDELPNEMAFNFDLEASKQIIRKNSDVETLLTYRKMF